ncbi:unnamed protein product [Paramecium primaurelia]|uniref:Uncharacterized protein n=3 Tax=Paramecium TaxID=5884 RepID=A0A8S1W043_9CILI|nr:unnamed protein product [Paramecium primaurelia]CAD8181512.1 unnamed protein product [Paramecium pentaurelia]
MCTRIHASNNNNAMMYLKLREEGCDKNSARKFCRKQFCKIDQTQSFIGPPGHKILKILPDRLLGEKGWQHGFLMKYDLGVGYKESADLNEKFTPAEIAILKQYNEYEKKKNAMLLQKMLAVKKYADSLRPPKLDVFSKSYLQRVKQISQELRESQQKPKKYFEFDDMKFYALVDYFSRQGSKQDLMHINFDPIVKEDIKFKTENTHKVNTARTFRRMGTISNIEKEANFIMALQQQAPLGQDLEKIKQKPEVLSLLKLNHQKMDLAEEFNSTQYLFTPTNAQTQQVNTVDDDAMKSFVQQFYSKQYDEKSNFLMPFKRNIRMRTQANSDSKKTPRKPTNKIKTQSIS